MWACLHAALVMIGRMNLARRAHTATTRFGVVVCAVVLALMQSLSLLHAWQHGPAQVAAVKPFAVPLSLVPGLDQAHHVHGGHGHAAHHDDWGHAPGDLSCQVWLALGHGADDVAGQLDWPAPEPGEAPNGPAWLASDASASAWTWARAPPHFL